MLKSYKIVTLFETSNNVTKSKVAITLKQLSNRFIFDSKSCPIDDKNLSCHFSKICNYYEYLSVKKEKTHQLDKQN